MANPTSKNQLVEQAEQNKQELMPISASTSPKHPSPFRLLSPEIRNKIYDYVLNSDSENVLIDEVLEEGGSKDAGIAFRTPTSILCVNRQIAEESLSMLRYFIITAPIKREILPLLAQIVPVLAINFPSTLPVTAPIIIHLFSDWNSTTEPSEDRDTVLIKVKHLPQVVDFLNAWQANLPSLSTGAISGLKYNRITGLSVYYQAYDSQLASTMSGMLTHPQSNESLFRQVKDSFSRLRLGPQIEEELHGGELHEPIKFFTCGWTQDGISKEDMSQSIDRPIYTEEKCIEFAMREKEKGDKHWELCDLDQASVHYKQAFVWAGLHFLGEKRGRSNFDGLKYSSYMSVRNLLLDHSRLDTERGHHMPALEKAYFVLVEVLQQEVNATPLGLEFKLRHAHILIEATIASENKHMYLHFAKRVASDLADKDKDMQRQYDKLNECIGEERRQRRFVKRLYKAGAASRAASKEAISFWDDVLRARCAQRMLPGDVTYLKHYSAAQHQLKGNYDLLESWSREDSSMGSKPADPELVWEIRRNIETLHQMKRSGLEWVAGHWITK